MLKFNKGKKGWGVYRARGQLKKIIRVRASVIVYVAVNRSLLFFRVTLEIIIITQEKNDFSICKASRVSEYKQLIATNCSMRKIEYSNLVANLQK